MTQFFQANDGARLAFSDDGEGVAVLCLAGLTRNMADFDYVAPYLSDCRMIRMDYRGRGQSQWTGVESYTVAQEARDAIALLDHLGIDKAAVLGTSRGGLIGLFMAATAKHRMSGLCLNDVGPEIETRGLDAIIQYIGRNPSATTYEQGAERLQSAMSDFDDVPDGRWLADAQKHYEQTDAGLQVRYDPALREAFIAAFNGKPGDQWPLWQATAGLPVALIRGANSNLLSAAVAERMQGSRPDLIYAQVPGRGHIPWLDEPESVGVLREWLAAVGAA